METNEQKNAQYQSGGYANYQGPRGEVEMSPQPQEQNNEYPQNKDPQYIEQLQFNQPNEEDALIGYQIRNSFIRKTYGILLSQLALTTLFISLTFIKSVREKIQFNLKTNPIIGVFLFLFGIITFAIFIILACCKEIARKYPTNYILLFSYTLCMSFYLSLLCVQYNTKTVFSALLLTCAATIGLTLYAMSTKRDFTFCGGFLFSFFLILFFSFILFWWIGAIVIYLALGIALYAFYLIYDTQLILGKFGNEYDIDDYCFAALNLYVDIIYLFIKILKILGSRDN